MIIDSHSQNLHQSEATCWIAWIDYDQSSRNAVWFCLINGSLQLISIHGPQSIFIQIIWNLESDIIWHLCALCV